MTTRDKGAVLIGVVLVGLSIFAVCVAWTQDHRDAALGRSLRQLALDGQAPMLTHSEHGWYCHLRCGREPVVFRASAEEAVGDAVSSLR